MNLENEPRGHAAPVIENNELRTLVETDPRQTVRDMKQQFGHYLVVSRHLNPLGKVKNLC